MSFLKIRDIEGDLQVSIKIDLIGEFCGENTSLCSLEEILSTLIADVSKMDLGLPLDSCL